MKPLECDECDRVAVYWTDTPDDPWDNVYCEDHAPPWAKRLEQT